MLVLPEISDFRIAGFVPVDLPPAVLRRPIQFQHVAVWIRLDAFRDRIVEENALPFEIRPVEIRVADAMIDRRDQSARLDQDFAAARADDGVRRLDRVYIAISGFLLQVKRRSYFWIEFFHADVPPRRRLTRKRAFISIPPNRRNRNSSSCRRSRRRPKSTYYGLRSLSGAWY